jgi:hypothetical protein
VSTCSALCYDWDVQDRAWSVSVLGSGVSFCEAAVLKESFLYDFKAVWMNMTGAASPRSEVVASLTNRKARCMRVYRLIFK